jgi:transposase
MCQNEVVADLTERGPSMEQISRIGMDTSKRFFQLHGMNTAETVVLRKKLRRKEMVTFFEKLGDRSLRRFPPLGASLAVIRP